eukprot:gene5755-6049_t
MALFTYTFPSIFRVACCWARAPTPALALQMSSASKDPKAHTRRITDCRELADLETLARSHGHLFDYIHVSAMMNRVGKAYREYNADEAQHLMLQLTPPFLAASTPLDNQHASRGGSRPLARSRHARSPSAPPLPTLPSQLRLHDGEHCHRGGRAARNQSYQRGTAR